MARMTSEQKIVNRLVDAASDIRVNRYEVGALVAHLTWPVQKRLLMIVLAIIEMMAIRWDYGDYEPEEYEYLYLVRGLRDEIVESTVDSAARKG
jgi:hypothetical protein